MQEFELIFDNEKKMYYTNASILKGLLFFNTVKIEKSNYQNNSEDQNINKQNTNIDNTNKENNETKINIPISGSSSNVELVVVRGQYFTHGGRSANYGKLYVNGQYWFDTGERSMLQAGTYKVAFKKETGCTYTGRKDWLKKGNAGNPLYQFVKYSNGYVPLVLGTGGRGGIRIHQGTSVAWSEGCLIVGNYKNGKLENSWDCWKKLYDYCYNAKSVTITYQG